VNSTVTLAACCPTGSPNECGLDVSGAASLLGLSGGCVEIGRPGSADPSCAGIASPISLPNVPASFAGCCGSSGTCGAHVDLQSAIGVNFGCVDLSGFVDASQPRSCGADAGNAGEAGSDSSDAGGGSDSALDSETGPAPVCGGSSVGLVAHYRADDNATDSSGRGHHGTFVPAGDGATLGFLPGHSAQAFNFLGNGYIQTSDAADLDVKVGATLAAWIRVDGGAGTHRDLISKDGEGYVNAVGGDFERQYLLTVSNLDRLRAHVGTPGGLKVLDGATAIPLGSWIHAAMTYDALTGALVLYLNRVADANLVVPAGDRCVIDTPQPLRIGGGAPAPYDPLFFAGLMDDVRVYDRALTATEISTL
jgi:hypothetical protein